MATSSQPPGLPGRRQQSGVYVIAQDSTPKRIVKIRRPVRAEPPPLTVPCRDDWKSPTWVLAYVSLTAYVLWAFLHQ